MNHKIKVTSYTEEFYGVTVNVNKLAEGLLKLIYEHPDGACMTYGMFPSSIMEAFEKALKQKVPDCYHLGDLIERDGEEVRRQIEHAVCCKILDLATKQGFCIV